MLLLLNEKLFPYLNEVDEQAHYPLDTMILEMMKQEGVTEEFSISILLQKQQESAKQFD